MRRQDDCRTNAMGLSLHYFYLPYGVSGFTSLRHYRKSAKILVPRARPFGCLTVNAEQRIERAVASRVR